jgi:thiol:disulfide interchange protein
MALLYALLGGLILNVMPCVLPVIGLKVLSFVQQAGESRSKILALNVWYSLGLLSVFLVLATVAVIWNLVWGKQFGWGEQFTSDVFTITMTAVVFAMGLSFLGVWEIPIPGFAGGEAANKLAEKEGPAGAFAKGVITTILATPCTGPGVAIAWAYCQGKPAGFVYLILATMGLGMASPYLLIGAFPKLMRILPKPGMWMETFKQFMGLVLMGTAVYLLTFTHWVNVLPALTLLLGLAVACWWLGRISITAEFSTRLRGWLIAALIVIVSGVFAFFPGKVTVAGYSLHGLRSIMGYRFERDVARAAASQGDSDPILDSPEIARQITKHDTEIRWVPYTEKRLNRLIAQDRTVLVDFTADWCPTCKWLEATVLNTQDVRDVLRQNGVVTLVADWTKHDPEVTRKLDSLGSAQVPVVAIFPAGRPNDRVILRGFYSKATLLDKLKQAGQSPVVEEVNYGAGCL